MEGAGVIIKSSNATIYSILNNTHSIARVRPNVSVCSLEIPFCIRFCRHVQRMNGRILNGLHANSDYYNICHS